MKGYSLVQRGKIMKQQKYIDEILKSPLPEPLGQFQPNLAEIILECGELKFVQMKDSSFFQEEIIMK